MVDIVDMPEGDEESPKAVYERLKRELPDMLKSQALVAEMRNGSYEAHIKAGFTKEEAFSILLTSIRDGWL